MDIRWEAAVPVRRMLGILTLALLAAAACGQPQSGTPSGATPTGQPAASGPVITAFHIINDVTCTGAQTEVPASWVTTLTKSVAFQVDGKPVSAGAGYPTSGKGNVPVPCDGKEHKVVLVASGEGTTSAVAAHVNTQNAPPPPTAPVITNFQILATVNCPSTNPTVEVPAAWTTQNAQTISFAVDDQPLSAAAGFQPNGAGNIPVPCDGKDHEVSLTASGPGGSKSLSRSVNTTIPPQ
jgi:hypothetical protein